MTKKLPKWMQDVSRKRVIDTRMKKYKEGLKEAIKDEYKAPKFYRSLAKKTKDKQMKDTLKWIAKQEEGHHKKLKVIQKKVK